MVKTNKINNMNSSTFIFQYRLVLYWRHFHVFLTYEKHWYRCPPPQRGLLDSLQQSRSWFQIEEHTVGKINLHGFLCLLWLRTNGPKVRRGKYASKEQSFSQAYLTYTKPQSTKLAQTLILKVKKSKVQHPSQVLHLWECR